MYVEIPRINRIEIEFICKFVFILVVYLVFLAKLFSLVEIM